MNAIRPNENIGKKWEEEKDKNTSSLNIPTDVKNKIDTLVLPKQFSNNPYASSAARYGIQMAYECLATRSDILKFAKTCTVEEKRDFLTDALGGSGNELIINNSVLSPFSLFQTNILPSELQKGLNINEFAKFINDTAIRMYQESKSKKETPPQTASR